MASAFDKIVQKWIKDALALTPAFPGVIVIRSEQNGPRPKGDYVRYKVPTWTPSDFDSFDKSEIDGDDDNINVDHFNRNRVPVSVNAYSENGREMLSRVSYSRKKWEIRRVLENEKVSHLKTGVVRDLTGLGDTEYRRRFQVDFTFLVWTGYLEIRPKVKAIELSGTTRF